MTTLLVAIFIGFFAQLRSLTAPAATAWAVYLGWLKLERLLAGGIDGRLANKFPVAVPDLVKPTAVSLSSVS